MKYFAKYNERVKTLQERVEQTERTEESIENLEEIKESIQEASAKLEEEIEEACKELEKDVNKEEIVLPPPIERKETKKDKEDKAMGQTVEDQQIEETNKRAEYTSINNKSIEKDEINKIELGRCQNPNLPFIMHRMKQHLIGKIYLTELNLYMPLHYLMILYFISSA